MKAVVPQGTAMALLHSVIAEVPQIHECIVGLNEVESQDELTCGNSLRIFVAAGTYFTYML